MNSSERKLLLNEIKRLEDALVQEREENRILKQNTEHINSCKDEYEKLIADAREEVKAAKEMKEYFGKLKDDLAKELSNLR